MEIKYKVNGKDYMEEVSDEDLEAASDMYDNLLRQERNNKMGKSPIKEERNEG